ncbi:hypothetical protein DP44_4646 [Burkholderia pseudomallei]|nr:hypothetical protein DP44_4646 [Burkholderia pseudomallei]KGS89637.1 hypothetical protein X947_1840 [Burkholderia pseudomallei MSHR7334]BEH24907.1 hypothetical protein GTC050_21590 [Burkholderia pseudomallei]BEH30044.1 hypothetical protein GTC054_12600 [Burkholderia pseudomallei]
MTHSSRRMPRALCDGRAGGRRAMGLRRGRAHANAKEGETNRGRAAKKKDAKGANGTGRAGRMANATATCKGGRNSDGKPGAWAAPVAGDTRTARAKTADRRIVRC